MKFHRDSQKRIIIDDCVFFVTTKTYNNHPFFKEPLFGDLFIENLTLCKQLKKFDLYAWFLGYDHFHLLLKPGEEFGLSDVMFSIKKQFSHDINRVVGFNELYPHQSKADKRLSAFGKHRELFLQHHKNIENLKTQFLQKYETHQNIPIFQWQLSFHDHYIRSKQDFNNHWGYIKQNPTRHNLTHNWKYHFLNPNYEYLIDNFL